VAHRCVPGLLQYLANNSSSATDAVGHAGASMHMITYLTGHRVGQSTPSPSAKGHTHTPRSLVSVLLLHAEGPLSKESPTSSADLRLLCSGQFLDNAKTLKGASTDQRWWTHAGTLTCKSLPTPAAAADCVCLLMVLPVLVHVVTEYHKLMGSPEALAVVTMHVLVRPPQMGKAAGGCRGRSMLPSVLHEAGPGMACCMLWTAHCSVAAGGRHNGLSGGCVRAFEH
jgi:hypothetical protein